MDSNAAPIQTNQPVVLLPIRPSGAGVDVLAVTEDDFFLLQARKVIALPNRLWHATSDAQAADMLVSTPCAAVLLDSALLGSLLPTIVARLQHQFPDIGLAVTGEASDEPVVTALLDSGIVQAFVSKQEAGRALAGALEAAIGRHYEWRAQSTPDEAPAWRRPAGVLAISAGALAIIAATATTLWYLSADPKPATAPAAESATAPEASPQLQRIQEIEQRLQRAREAFEAGRYLPGEQGDSALEHYRAVLALDALQPEAKDGLSRITEILLARTELALVQGDTRQAAEALKAARTIEPGHPRIAFLETQIAREMTRTASAMEEAQRVAELNRKLEELRTAQMTVQTAPLPQAAPSNTAAAQLRGSAEADRLLALGYERLNQGKLLQPADDNARDYLMKLRQLQPNHPSLAPALTALRERLLTDTQQAIEKRNVPLAQNLLNGARGLGADEQRVNALATAVSRTSLQMQLLTNPEVLQASMIAKQVTPEYPARARREGVDGHVDLRFVSSTDGEVRDVVVVNAQPQGYFEEAAVQAVQRWKIKPRVVESERYEVLYSLRLRFKLD